MLPSDDDWRPPGPSSALVAGSVHLWRIMLQQSATTRERLARHLAADEHARAARLAFARDRDRFLVAHGALREILARYLACVPGAVAIRVSARGKPEIVEPESQEDGALRFSLAHSGELALVSVTRIGATGVDVEWMRPEVEALAIAERFFATEECEALRSQPEDRRAAYFYTLWTSNEAYLKALGIGLTAPLGRMRVLGGGDAETIPLTLEHAGAGSPSRWSLVRRAAGEGYVGALAVEGKIETLALWEWTGDQV